MLRRNDAVRSRQGGSCTRGSKMGFEATWSLVDIPPDARDAAQAAARREGVSVGEWLTRRILRRFSEMNTREHEESFVTLRNHVAELAERLDRFEGQART